MDFSAAGSASGTPGALGVSDRPIFVVACPRSGTTLLQLMLHAHPRIAIPPENRFFLGIYRDRRRFGDLRRAENRRRVAEAITRDRHFADLGIPAELLVDRIVEGPATIGSAMGIVFREYAALHGKPRWGDKRPLLMDYIPVVLKLFPDAQVVSIVRDGRACVASLKRMPWWTWGSMAAITRWVQSLNMGARARASLRPDQYHEVQYERLVADPRPELERLCAFLGEQFDEAMLEPQRLTSAVPERKTWHARTSGSVSAGAVRWTAELEPWEVAVLETLGRRHLRRYGYELSPDRPRPPAPKLAQAAAHLARREVGTYAGRHRDRLRERAYGYPVAAQLTSAQVRRARANGELVRSGFDGGTA